MEVINPCRIKVIGVGGGGSNAVNRMYEDGIEGVELYAVNTDVQHLSSLKVPNKIQIGEKVTRGLGAGARPEIGEEAALEDIDKIKEILRDADMVFIATGLGGGTGTGAAPVIAKTAKDMGILTVAVATLPFKFEGRKKMEIALKGLERLKESADAYIVIHNQKIAELAGRGLSIKEAFKEVDSVLSTAVRGITSIVVTDAQINVDFADVKTTLENGGLAIIGMGEGTGEEKADVAVERAVTNPLLEGNSIEGARRLLVTLWTSEDVPYDVVEEVMERINERISDDAQIIFGAVFEPEKEDFIRVAIVATDFPEEKFEVEGKEVSISSQTFKVIKNEEKAKEKKEEKKEEPPPPPETFEEEEIPAYIRRKKKSL
ncbi:MAG: cell division protein FtsZ [Aquificae bacterium]|nr:cell division protein FtsZ [Aquificota bacterium]